MSHRFLAAALVTGAAALSLSSTAQASTVELKSDGTLSVRTAVGETNNVHIKPEGVTGLRLRDFGAKLTVRGSGCTPLFLGSPEFICRNGITRVDVALADGNDVYVGQHGFATVVDGGDGNDHYFHDGKAGVTTTRTEFRGGPGDDSANYSVATAGVIVTKDGVANDGRTINGTFVIDRDNIREDVEKLVGSAHNDSLNGSNVANFPGKLLEQFNGGGGSDIMTGGPADDFFDMGRSADGADIIRGGGSASAIDAVSYAGRTQKIVATVGHGTRDDGEAGESDDITGVERVFGGSGDDVISQVPNSPLALQIFGGLGNDTLIGAFGADFMNGDDGVDTYNAGPGADTIFAAHVDRDAIDCGSNPLTAFDSVTTDPTEGSVRGCEDSRVGKLRLKASGSDVDVIWTHPKAWRKLRSVTVRVLDDARQIGTVEITPRSSKLVAKGAVRLGRNSALTRDGKTVSAQLALKVDKAFAGRTLAFEVEATDVDGRRQVER